MALHSSKVSKSLDRKLKIVGFEVPDILAIFLLLAILNFLFSDSSHKLLLSWGPTIVFALTLRVGKRGKPPNYLVHFVKYKLNPKYYRAFNSPKSNSLKLIKGDKSI